MKRAKHSDKEKITIAKSLETVEWVSDLSGEDKKRYEGYAKASLTKKQRIKVRIAGRKRKGPRPR